MTRDEVVRRLEADIGSSSKRWRSIRKQAARVGFPGATGDSLPIPTSDPAMEKEDGSCSSGSGRIPNRSWISRRCHIEDKKLRCHNPHIAGTGSIAVTSGVRLGRNPEHTCRQILRRYPESHWKANPLSFCGS